MKIYRGHRDEEGNPIILVQAKGSEKQVKHIQYHSPSGIEWGYAGSGPADAALSILADFFGESGSDVRKCPQAEQFHQQFKWDFINNAPHEGFRISEAQISTWLQEQKVH